MNSGNFNISGETGGKNLRKLRILVAPLDWGLGHATRCIPVINELIRQDCDVWLAGEGAQKVLLMQEFPGLTFLDLPGYRIKYGRSALSLAFSVFKQTRKILKAIREENDWLKKINEQHGFDAVISDNRYGMYHTDIPCVFITHQLLIKSSFGKWSERILQKKNYQYINRFTECWIPDEADGNNLAGELSHPSVKPAVKLEYIGHLSRLEQIPDQSTIPGSLLIILSGPEPQRTIFENKIIKDIVHYPGTATIVRGLPGGANLIPSTNHIRFYNHLPADELNKEMNKAEYIISRSGYSTVMDIVTLRKKSILIPTPGQTEQEYLAKYLQEKGIAVSIRQKSFSLDVALRSAKSFSYTNVTAEDKPSLQQTIAAFLHSLLKN